MNEKLGRKIYKVIQDYPDEELALGFLRYETLRKFNLRQFADLHKKNINSEVIFDEEIDKMIK